MSGNKYVCKERETAGDGQYQLFYSSIKYWPDISLFWISIVVQYIKDKQQQWY
jgi:hypothetical protein